MLTKANTFPQLRAAFFLSLMSGMIATISTRDAAAQARAQPNYIIEVSLGANNACYYEIQDPKGARLSGQDLLSVKPGNKVRFKSTNAEAVIEVSKNRVAVRPRQGNRLRGFTGGRRDNSFDLGPGAEKTVNARADNRKGNSRHKIVISCVSGDDELESNTKPSGPSFDTVGSIILIPAVPLPDPNLIIPGPNWIHIRIPDLKKLPPSPWRVPGGPEMEVEE